MVGERVVVTGAAGLLGTWLLRTAPDPDAVVAAHHRSPVMVTGGGSVQVDLRDRAGTVSALAGVRPDLMIHTAYARDRASIVEATENVVAAADAAGAAVVFVSSDAVFAGDGVVSPEDSAPDATWDYGRWKAEAERLVLAAGRGAAVVRLPLLVSIDPEDHAVRRIRAGVESGDPSRWYVDEIRQPVRAAEAAAGIWRIAGLPAGDRAGCWHLPGAEQLSRLQLADRLLGPAGLPPTAILPASRPGGGDRPRHIALGDSRARTAIGWDPTPVP